MKKIQIAIVWLMLCSSVAAQKYQALRFRQATSFFNYEMMTVHEQYDERKKSFNEAILSKVSMQKYVKDARARFKKLVGNLPKRNKIESKVVDTVRCNGFYIEKIIFLSAPGRYVTTHLYLPNDLKGKIPACIEMCGHGQRGKGSGSVLAERMAVNGIAVMVVDPLSQGERQQTIDDQGNNLTRGVTTEHTLIAPSYILLGSNLAAQEFYDNSRAIDYLLTRKDIDGEKIGCYGFSGGGTQAAYLIGLDERIQAGCVGLFFSSRERTLETQGPSDGCQWVPFEGKEKIEIADMVMMNAPKPCLVLDGLYDFVDHWGALQGFEEVQRCYTTLGYPERVNQYYSEDGHATPLDVQEKMVRWFRRWLLKDSGPLKTVDSWMGNNMLCTSTGQVNLEYSDSKSTMKACADEMDALAKEREEFCKQSIPSIQQKIKKLLGIDSFNDEIEMVQTKYQELRDVREYRYQLNCKGEYPVPVVVRIPFNVTPTSPIVIHLLDCGKDAWLEEKDRTDFVSNGSIMIAADLRGFGETRDLFEYNLSKYWNQQYRTAVVALHTGKPLMGQRVADIRTLVNFCSQQTELAGHPIEIVSDGINALAVMHATVLDDRIKRSTLTNTLKTWRSYIVNPMQRDMIPNILVGVLRYYDIPDLLRLSHGRIIIQD